MNKNRESSQKGGSNNCRNADALTCFNRVKAFSSRHKVLNADFTVILCGVLQAQSAVYWYFCRCRMTDEWPCGKELNNVWNF